MNASTAAAYLPNSYDIIITVTLVVPFYFVFYSEVLFSCDTAFTYLSNCYIKFDSQNGEHGRQQLHGVHRVNKKI